MSKACSDHGGARCPEVNCEHQEGSDDKHQVRDRNSSATPARQSLAVQAILGSVGNQGNHGSRGNRGSNHRGAARFSCRALRELRSDHRRAHRGPGLRGHAGRPRLHSPADQDRRGTRCQHDVVDGSVWSARRRRSRSDPEPVVVPRSADRRRDLQQPDSRTGDLRRRRPGLPAADHSRLPRRGVQSPAVRSPWSRDLVCADRRAGVRHRTAHDQQPDRRSDLDQPGRRGRRPVPAAIAGQRRRRPVHDGAHDPRWQRWAACRVCAGSPDAGHPERHHRRRPLAAVQLAVHDLRPVLRSRPRQDHQRWQRHRVRAAERGRPAGRRTRPCLRQRRRPA